MADPIVVKVSELPELMDLAAGDLITAVDVSEMISADKTKKLQAGNIKVFSTAQLAANVVENAQIKNGAVTGAKIDSGTITSANLAAAVNNDINRNLVYIQLFQPDEAIITASARTQFFVPATLAGKQVKQIGMGIVTAQTGKTVTIQLGTSGAYGSISGGATKEETVTKTLPSTLTKIPINVSVTAGSPAPKGLDFWFLVY